MGKRVEEWIVGNKAGAHYANPRFYYARKAKCKATVNCFTSESRCALLVLTITVACRLRIFVGVTSV